MRVVLNDGTELEFGFRDEASCRRATMSGVLGTELREIIELGGDAACCLNR